MTAGAHVPLGAAHTGSLGRAFPTVAPVGQIARLDDLDIPPDRVRGVGRSSSHPRPGHRGREVEGIDEVGADAPSQVQTRRGDRGDVTGRSFVVLGSDLPLMGIDHFIP